jgi:hypothetical protein
VLLDERRRYRAAPPVVFVWPIGLHLNMARAIAGQLDEPGM